MELSKAFNKKAAAVAAAALVAVAAVPTWSSFQHDRILNAQFQSAVQENTTPRLLTIETDGVTRQGFLNRGAVLDRLYPGSDAFLIASKPQAACWYTTLRVTKGQGNLPFWQKIFGGAEIEWLFASSAYGIIGSRCAPTQNGQTIETVQSVPLALKR